MSSQIKTLHIDIVSIEKEIYSDDVEQVIATGEFGELGIMPGHTALLAKLKPGAITLVKNGKLQLFYVSGGMLEVQPCWVTVLADTAARASDLDEMKAIEAAEKAERALKEKQSTIDSRHASAELAKAMAQLQVISKLRDRLQIN